jgi:putative Mg2+ transporter-C (MgtC) family protein
MDAGFGWMVIKLVLAAVLGGLIGFEREAHGRPAGLRTHILVSMGSALFTIVSISFGYQHSDPSRVASQIVSGIGFLGAGTIIRQGSIVRGLTTAASLWTVAAIGMAVGTGGSLIYLAVVASLIVFLTLGAISRIERTMSSRARSRELILTVSNRSAIAGVISVLSGPGFEVQRVRSEEISPGILEVKLHTMVPLGVNINTIDAQLAALDGVTSFDWE